MGALRIVWLLAVAAVVLSAVPSVLPDIGAARAERDVRQSMRAFALDRGVHGGMYRASPRTGDTQPSYEATRMATYVLQGDVTHRDDAKERFTRECASAVDGMSMSRLHDVVLTALAVGAQCDAQVVESQVLAHWVNESGFRDGPGSETSVRSTLQALDTLTALGALGADVRRASVRFVRGLRDGADGGFRNEARDKYATLTATAEAVRVLAFETRGLAASRAVLEDVPSFVAACQALDGGFADAPLRSPLDHRTRRSALPATARALGIVHALAAADLPARDEALHYTAAVAFLQGCHQSHGVMSRDVRGAATVESAYEWMRLVREVPHVRHGRPMWVDQLCSYASVACAAAALALLLLPPHVLHVLAAQRASLARTTALLTMAMVVLVWAGRSFAALAYVAVAALLLREALRHHSRTAMHQACVFVIVHCGAFLALERTAPALFAHMQAQRALWMWSAPCTWLSIVLSRIVLGVRSDTLRESAVGGALIGWLVAQLLEHSFLFIHGHLAMVMRMIALHGLLPVALVLMPITNLAACYSVALMAAGPPSKRAFHPSRSKSLRKKYE